MVAGAIITGIAYTELTPPDWDQNYDRYKGSDLKRILGKCPLHMLSVKSNWIAFSSSGPILIASGGLILFGSCGFFVYAFLTDTSDEYSPPGTPKLQHKYTSPAVTVAKMYEEEEDLDIEKQWFIRWL